MRPWLLPDPARAEHWAVGEWGFEGFEASFQWKAVRLDCKVVDETQPLPCSGVLNLAVLLYGFRWS